METSHFHTAHALAPDLEAIQALAGRRLHAPAEEGPPALAIYEDVCWRLALAQFPAPVAAEVRRLEGEAASLLRQYLGAELEGQDFWRSFRDVVEALDGLAAGVDAQAQDELEAGRELRALRERIAHAGLPLLVRRQVQTTLELAEGALAAFHAGKVAAEDFWPLFRRGEAAIEAAIAEAGASDADAAEARLERVAEDLLAAPPPAFMRTAIASRLIELADAFELRRPLPIAALDELELLLARAAQFREVFTEAERRCGELETVLAGRLLAPPFRHEADGQLAAMHELLAALAGGRLEPDVFQDRFEVAARRLGQLLTLAGPGRAPLAEAEAFLAQARARVAAAGMPRFVALAAQELLAHLDRLLAEQRASGEDTYAFWRAFRDALADLGLCMAFGREVAHERTLALRRFEQLERRLDGRELHPMLRGPAMDLLETLRNLLNRLERGLFTLIEFQRTFDEAAGRVETLLAWQNVLESGVTPPAPLASGHHPEG